ncbi:cell wall biosynthesis protein [uncultured Methanobrevibacter sp.]|uniref:cell wall biosynthesis protein n=1 Tax=uncultured Methanobrevibacter sp. TaxID=253161 RepID=UPI0025E878AB|nr:cell wall biosynthesis protein [uncultured Methanobrevibacter sp.]
MYSGVINALIQVFFITFFATMALDIIMRKLGKRGFIHNLYPNVRGGTPRGVGLVLFFVLSFYVPDKYSDLILIIGLFAFMDDILGRSRISHYNMQWGQLFRGIGMILVMVAGFCLGLGLSSIFIALLIQPLNISDMQPGSTCIVTLIISSMVLVLTLLFNVNPADELLPSFYTPLLIIVAILAYCPLDFAGKIMLGEVGNHSIAIALGISFYLLGGLPAVLIFGLITSILIAFVRRNTLNVFFTHRMGLFNPVFCDYLMDVLTGGGLGDFIRKLIWKNKQPIVNNNLLILLGARRLVYNPAAHRSGFINY